MKNLSRIAELAFTMAKEEAKLQRSKEVLITHLFISVLAMCNGFHQSDGYVNRFRFVDASSRNEINKVYNCIIECRIDPIFSIKKLRLIMYKNKDNKDNYEMLAEELLKISYKGFAGGIRQVNLFWLVLKILNNKSKVIDEYFESIDLDTDDLMKKITKAKEQFENDPNNIDEQRQKIASNLSDAQKDNDDGTESKGSYLLKYGMDITKKAELGQLNKIVGRKSEIKETARILLQRQKGNPLLIGEPGVGKTSIVEGLAQYIKAEDASEAIKDLRIIQINITSLVAGSKYRGDFEEKIEGVINEASADKNVILFIDEIHTMMGAGVSDNSSGDAANILKPALAGGEIRCIGATTITEYKKYIEKDGALKRRFQVVHISEPTAENAITILCDIKEQFEEYHGVQISDKAVEQAVRLSITYLPELRLPDKAIEILDRACSEKKLGTITNVKDIQNIKKEITENDIIHIVAKRANIPIDSLTSNVSKTYKDLQEKLKQYISGQDEAINIIAKTIQKAKAGFKNEEKPVGVFMLLGNTGTGKTYLAECLAEILYGSKDRLIDFDMSEYKESHSVARLLGSPPGYVGYGDEGLLSKKVGRNPASVILFDEIEKADASIMDIFIPMFDKGKVTDASGKVIDFRQTIIIVTSNLITNDMSVKSSKLIGFAQATEEASKSEKMNNEEIFNTLQKHIRAEILNRIENIIIFNKLSDNALLNIAKKYRDDINNNMAKKNIHISISDDMLDYVLSRSMTDEYGAREIRRSMDKYIVEPLVEYIIDNDITKSDVKKTLTVEKQDDRFFIKED